MENERIQEGRKFFRTTGLGRYMDYILLGGGEEWSEKKLEERQKQRREANLR
jgi:hypothetical protein